MSIFISNTAYAASVITADDLPIIAWKSVLSIGDISASGFQNSRPASNVWGADTATFWEGATGGDGIFINLANVGASSIDYVAIAKHNLGSAEISYRVYTSADGTTFTPLTPERTVTDDSPIVEYFNPSTAPLFQIRFTGAAAPIIAHVRMGAVLILPRSIYVGHAPGTISKVVERVSQVSAMGQFLGQIVTRTSYKTSVKQENVKPEFIRQHIKPFIAHVDGTRPDDGTARGTFFFAWRPDFYPDEVMYAWTDSEIRPENQRSNGMMSFGFEVAGVA